MKRSTAIAVTRLSKKYRIGGREQSWTIREHLDDFMRHPFGIGKHESPQEDFWALKNVSFTVERGDVVGIIGRNGSGKSTLLKILSRIVEPTEGKAILHGKVSSLLEVGTGFNQELTGRENIYLNGSILGMSKKEINRKFNQILEFSGVEQFMDTPVKRYSSGMYVRLAFAVAAHLDADILLVDEVLAVGDIQFQKKCLGKMNELAGSGKTVLFVSHDMGVIRNLCPRSILLHHGHIEDAGPTHTVINRYLRLIDTTKSEFPIKNQEITVLDFAITQNNHEADHIDNDKDFQVTVKFKLDKEVSHLRLGFFVKNVWGDTVLRCFMEDWDTSHSKLQSGAYQASIDIPRHLFMAGSFDFCFHASVYGKIDFFPYDVLKKQIIILPMQEFNQLHPNEPYEAHMVLDRLWQLKKL